jgi:hypothetical protein
MRRPTAAFRGARTQTFVITVVLVLTLPGVNDSYAAAAQAPSNAILQQRSKLNLTVIDETQLAVGSAQITLLHKQTQSTLKGATDYTGRLTFSVADPGPYHIRIEKENFYAASVEDVRLDETTALQVVLYHVREFSEVLDVPYSPPAIDRTKTSASEGLSAPELLTLPYPNSRDIRNALPFIPGVVQDPAGRLHMNGSQSSEILNQLDGFKISHPVNGGLELRVSADAVRSVEVQGSRYSTEYGNGSGGVLSLATGMGDDRYRFSATNFVPSVQNQKGLHLDNWTPRASISGPIRKKRAWFFDAADAEYNLDIIDELPEGADRNSSWRFSNLTKVQVNLSQTDILNVGFLVNRFHSDHTGLSRFSPLETTVGLTEAAYLLTLKEQSYLSNGVLLEFGLGVNQFRTDERPLGESPFLVRPEGTSGNFFRTSSSRASRVQLLANAIYPGFEWRGHHEFKTGIDADRITYNQLFERRPIAIFRADRTLSRQITFFDGPAFQRNNLELSAFAQDRWSISKRLLLELGLRADWDQIVRDIAVSPRAAVTYLLTGDGNTKLSAGLGLFHDKTSLDFVTRPLSGRREDLLFAEDGMTPLGVVGTSFEVNEAALKTPRVLNWSGGLDRRLPASVYLRVEYTQKRGSRGFAFANQGKSQPGARRAVFELNNERRDRYDSLQVSLRKTFRSNYSLFAAYTRSSARSNSVIDVSLDSPVFSRQGAGPLGWDAPNRLIAFGSLPLVRRFDLAYSLEWRDGYPFSLFDGEQQLVGSPNSRRLPDVFLLNAHVERRFRLAGYQWSLRAGFNNLTNRENPTGVNSNVDSPEFLTFGGVQHRTFVGRIRFLGRK